MPFLPGIMVGAAPPTSAAWLGVVGSVASGEISHNFGNFTAPAGGLMVVIALGRSGTANEQVSYINIGGAAATLHARHGPHYDWAAIASREVAAGARNVTVGMTLAIGTSPVHAVGVWLLTGYTNPVPVETYIANSIGALTSKSFPMNLPAKSAALYGCFHYNNTDEAWSSASELGIYTGGDKHISFARKQPPAAITPHTEVCSWATAAACWGISGVWR